ncbi:MAG: hypothetical protein C0609_08180 [Deltaproteobacteria bacterium]|nr:MAG: hypothetical protein C0609_08180 [Deltaproteobacteria bacterium]
MKKIKKMVLIGGLVAALAGCGSGGGGDSEGGGGISTSGDDVVVFAWNDLGMHCLNPSYDKAVILPPYNTVWAQVVERGNPPKIVTAGYTVEYSLVNNTSSSDKGLYGQFWDNAMKLFGVNLANDVGLTGSTLSGTMRAEGDHFQVDGIPVVPVDDDGMWNPYQVIEVKVKDSGGIVVATTKATVPTSDEIDCGKCHGADPFADIIAKHDEEESTSLAAAAPLLCANGETGCHVSPGLGQSMVSGATYLSQAVHSFHASVDSPPSCYDCHPGELTQCSRSISHTDEDGGCTNLNCHGSLANVGSSISSGRVPWVEEPKCANCHSASIAEVDTGTTLYRNARGHGGISCPSCHGSPHAMIPSLEPSDNYQAMQYQGKALTLGSCAVCHSSSRGKGLDEFYEHHGGTNPDRYIACHICHTAVSADADNWPHSYEWNAR